MRAFPLVKRHVQHYVQDKVVLLGDAAHSVHPLAGQCLNMGLADVRALIDVLTTSWQQPQALADPLALRRFSRQRLAHNGKRQRLFGLLNRFYLQPQPLVSGIRQTGMTLVNHWPSFKRRIIQNACDL